MNTKASYFLRIFQQAIVDYHVTDTIDKMPVNRYAAGSIENLFFHKAVIDTVQWHVEDLIRDPGIDPSYGLLLKRKIDQLNQERTDTVERLDLYFFERYGQEQRPGCRHNSETLGWAYDRLCILELKCFHVGAELGRPQISQEHYRNCRSRSDIIMCQKNDLLNAIDWMTEDIIEGKINIKLYRQLKMYNDRNFNPVLYAITNPS
jgi:hypothetical protein